MKKHRELIKFLLDTAIVALVLLSVCALSGLVAGQTGFIKAAVVITLCVRAVIDITKYENKLRRKAKAIMLSTRRNKAANAA
ncbi:MAG: hypothetical protein RSC96_04270 [Oscillospiraceae bacterium]